MDADPCIFFQWDEPKTHLQIISLYVDNLSIAADQQSDVDLKRSKLKQEYKMTDEPDNIFLQMKLTYKEGIITLSQARQIEALLISTNLSTTEPASTPMDTLTVSKADSPVIGSEEWQHMTNVPYRETIGSLTDIARKTRPDIAYAVSVASRYSANPGQKHWNQVKRILRYLKFTQNWAFKLDPGPSLNTKLQHTTNSTKIQGELRFKGWSDSDWGGQIEEAKSTTGYGWFLGNALVSYQSKTQPISATSSTMGEYIAAYHAAAECIWTRNFLSELGLLQPGPDHIALR
jgi:hypothetical protein